MKRVLIFVLFVVFSVNVNASGYLTSLGGPGVKITSYFTHSGGGVTLKISGSVSNPDGCEATDRVHLKGDLAGHNNMVAAALAAFASGKSVGLWSTGCETIPFWGGTSRVPIVANLWVFE